MVKMVRTNTQGASGSKNKGSFTWCKKSQITYWNNESWFTNGASQGRATLLWTGRGHRTAVLRDSSLKTIFDIRPGVFNLDQKCYPFIRSDNALYISDCCFSALHRSYLASLFINNIFVMTAFFHSAQRLYKVWLGFSNITLMVKISHE